jgi:urease accessory protein
MSISSFKEANLNKSWKAKLQLKFIEENNKTILSQRSHQGPLQVQKLFYPESNGACHVYILHPPGGVVGGDSFDVKIQIEPKHLNSSQSQLQIMEY